MIEKLEDLFIKVWRGASLLSVFFSVFVALALTKEIEGAGVRMLFVAGAVVCAAIFAGFTAWAVRLMDDVKVANKLAEKQLRVSSMAYQQSLKNGVSNNKG